MARVSNLPPGPSQLPVVQMYRWVHDPFSLLAECKRKFGDTFTLRLAGFGTAVFTGDPAFVHAVFTADPDVLSAAQANDVLLPFVGPNSLLTMDGARHRRDRKLMTPPFHGARMRAYGSIVQEAAARAIANWQVGTTVAAHPAMQATSLEVILRAVYGVGEASDLARAQHVITELLEGVTGSVMFFSALRHNFGPWSPWGRYLKNKAIVDRIMDDAIALRRESPGEDILSLLLAARDEQGNPLSKAELHDELVTLLLAGHETTATGLAWTLAWLTSTPDGMERLVAEVDANPGDPESVSKLPYLSAVCNEALRMRPVFPIVMRVATEDWAGPVTIPKGVRIAPCIYLVHQNEDLYPDPDTFRPERFLDRTFAPHEFLPFGGGARRCIGMAFALYEMKLVLAEVLRTYTLATDAARPGTSRRNLALAPTDGAQVRVVARRTT